MQAHKRLDYTRLLIRQEGPRYDAAITLSQKEL